MALLACEKAAAIEQLPPEEREFFAGRASRFRWLAKLAAEKAAEKAAIKSGEARKSAYKLARWHARERERLDGRLP